MNAFGWVTSILFAAAGVVLAYLLVVGLLKVPKGSPKVIAAMVAGAFIGVFGGSSPLARGGPRSTPREPSRYSSSPRSPTHPRRSSPS